MMLKSVLSKYARAGRNFSSRRSGESQGRRFCSSAAHSPKNNSGMAPFSENIKTILSLGKRILYVGMKTTVGGAGVTSGYYIAAAVMPDHAEPLIEKQELTKHYMKHTIEYIMENGEPEDLKKLEEVRKSFTL